MTRKTIETGAIGDIFGSDQIDDPIELMLADLHAGHPERLKRCVGQSLPPEARFDGTMRE